MDTNLMANFLLNKDTTMTLLDYYLILMQKLVIQENSIYNLFIFLSNIVILHGVWTLMVLNCGCCHTLR